MLYDLYFVYVLQSQIDNSLVVGFTRSLDLRIAEHNDGQIMDTCLKRPYELVYYEACKSPKDAVKRKNYLKSNYGRKFLKSRLKHSLTPKEVIVDFEEKDDSD